MTPIDNWENMPPIDSEFGRFLESKDLTLRSYTQTGQTINILVTKRMRNGRTAWAEDYLDEIVIRDKCAWPFVAEMLTLALERLEKKESKNG